jgi:alpha-galactosidase/6-phospho-beta-glucosidase family protein
LRKSQETFTNDVRLNNIRLGADGVCAQKMGLLQFASTLHATNHQEVPAKDGKDGEAPNKSTSLPFDPMAALHAMSWGATSTDGSLAARLGYQGEGAAKAWERKEKKRKKEKKREKKAARERKKEKKRAKITKLMKEKNMSHEDACNLVEDLESSSSSDSEKSSGYSS